MILQTDKKQRTANSTYPIGGVSSSKDSFVVNGSLVFQIKFCDKSPALRVAANRCGQLGGYVDSEDQANKISVAKQKNGIYLFSEILSQ